MKDFGWLDASVRARMLRQAVLTCCVLGALAAGLAWSIAQAERADEQVERTVDTLASLRALGREMLDAELGVRRYLANGEVDELAPYRKFMADDQGLKARLLGADPATPEQPALEALTGVSDAEASVLAQSVALKQHGQAAAADQLADANDQGGETLRFRAMSQAIFNAQTCLLVKRQRELRAKEERVLHAACLGGLFMAILILSAAKVSADRIHRRFDALMRGIEEVSGGRLGARVAVDSRDEFGALAAAFNKMAVNVAAANLARELAEALVASSVDAIVTVDLDGVVTSWNPAAETIFGYTSSEVLGRSQLTLVPEEQVEDLRRIVALTRQGQSVSVETKRRRKSGEVFHAAITNSPILNAAGQVIGASKIARDITERKAVEATTERLLARVVESNAELARFAYVASHDMQEPLRMIASFSQLMARECSGDLCADGREYLDIVISAATRMRDMIQDLLHYAEVPESGLEFQEVDLGGVLRDALENLRQLVAESRAVVTHDELPTLPCRRMQMVRLFQNLISNAIKYRDPGRAPAVHVGVEERQADWVISVRDNGQGIEERFLDEIFQPFRRLHHWAQIAGTGLGLPVCRKIAEHHGGSLWVRSVPGEGSEFSFSVLKASQGVDAARTETALF